MGTRSVASCVMFSFWAHVLCFWFLFCSTGGGALTFEQCSTSASSGDGRTVFAASPNGQLKMPRIGNYCLTLIGGGEDADVAQRAVAAASSSSAQHTVKSIADANAQSYWASGNDPTGPVDVQLDFGAMQTMKAVAIDWEHPAQACCAYMNCKPTLV